MTNDPLVNVLIAVLGVAGGPALVVGAIKWLVSDWMKRGEKLQEAQGIQLADIRSVAGELKLDAKALKLEAAALKDRIYTNEKLLIQAVERLKYHSDKFEVMGKAFEAFVETANERMGTNEAELKLVESKTDKAIVAIGQITRIKGTKPEEK